MSRVDLELVRSEADDLDAEVVLGGGKLVAKGDDDVVVAQAIAQYIGEFHDELARLLGAEADQRGDGVEGIEEEVRIDLALECVEAGFEEQTLLLFEGLLDADGVPDLEGNADDHGGAGPDGEADEPAVGIEGEEAGGIDAMNPLAESLHGNDEEEEQNLAIDAGTEQVAADPAVEAQIHEGGEGPDLLFFDEAAVDARDDGDGDKEGQRRNSRWRMAGRERTEAPMRAAPGPTRMPRRMVVSKEMSAA